MKIQQPAAVSCDSVWFQLCQDFYSRPRRREVTTRYICGIIGPWAWQENRETAARHHFKFNLRAHAATARAGVGGGAAGVVRGAAVVGGEFKTPSRHKDIFQELAHESRQVANVSLNFLSHR